jgi:hypothetical protein
MSAILKQHGLLENHDDSSQHVQPHNTARSLGKADIVVASPCKQEVLLECQAERLLPSIAELSNLDPKPPVRRSKTPANIYCADTLRM